MLCRGRSERLTNNWGGKREGAGQPPLLSPEGGAARGAGLQQAIQAKANASFGAWALDIFQVEIDLEHTNVPHELVVRQSTVDQISPVLFLLYCNGWQLTSITSARNQPSISKQNIFEPLR